MSTVVARAVRMRVAMFWLYTDSALCSNMQLCTRIGELNLHTCTCTSGMRCDRGVKTWRLGPCRDTSNIFDVQPSTAYTVSRWCDHPGPPPWLHGNWFSCVATRQCMHLNCRYYTCWCRLCIAHVCNLPIITSASRLLTVQTVRLPPTDTA